MSVCVHAVFPVFDVIEVYPDLFIEASLIVMLL